MDPRTPSECLRAARGFWALLALTAAAAPAFGQALLNQPSPEQLAGPEYREVAFLGTMTRPFLPEERTAWMARIKAWRGEARDRFGLSGRGYERPELLWTQSSFVQTQMMVHDRYFYDPVARRYTVARYLEDLRDRYGGIDSVLLWHGYPNLGVDDRNQYDLVQDLPGGPAAVREMIAEFHRANVRVLLPVYPWDQGTRACEAPAWDAMARELADAGADGINGDTLKGMPRVYRAASDRISHPLALEPEGELGSEEMLEYNTLSWGYWKHDFVPSISRYKWLESRHMVNICERWSRDHTDALQAAFFNGVGFESWENVWGIWMGITPRDAEALRRIAAVERRFAGLLHSPDWEPHAPTEQFGVFASRWPGRDATLWTLVNRNHYGVSGTQMVVPAVPGARYFDVWNGAELHPAARGSGSELSFRLEADGFGAVLQVSTVAPDLGVFLKTVSGMASRPLSDFSRTWKALPQQLVEIAAAAPAAAAPEGMVRIPAASFRFRVTGNEIEGQNYDGVDVQYPWEEVARRFHDHVIDVRSFWIDRYPVTNADFKRFVDATGYRPADAHNFLKDWTAGSYPKGWDRRPVTWVSLEDSRAYARWAGKRLPHEWEWQLAAQGTDGRTYPWGDSWAPEAAPAQDGGRTMLPPSEVDAHPAGASPFGVMDLVGNVWQWTDEYSDAHTRAAVLRGGSHYRPQSSVWYFPQAKELDRHAKLLLMAPSIDRSGTVGFRCARDTP